MKKISILSAVYNEENFISEMIKSVLEQNYDNFELLFVDDGSTDRTVSVIESFAVQDSRIKIISSGVKLGKAQAFNLAFLKSTGEYIVMLSGDDILTDESLSMRARAIDNASDINKSAKVVAYFKLLTFSSSKKFNGLIIPRGDRGNRSGGTCIMNRNLAASIFPIDNRLPNEDTWLAKMSEFKADKIIDNANICLKYRIHDGNSNPRHKKFDIANEALHARLLTYQYILETQSGLTSDFKDSYLRFAVLEDYRYNGKWFNILIFDNTSLKEKMFYFFHSTALLFNIRNILFGFFSGR